MSSLFSECLPFKSTGRQWRRIFSEINRAASPPGYAIALKPRRRKKFFIFLITEFWNLAEGIIPISAVFGEYWSSSEHAWIGSLIFYPITASQWVNVPHFSLPNVTFKNGQNFRSFIWFFSNHTVFSYNSPLFKAIFSDIRDIFLTISENPFFQKSLDNLHSSCYNQATRHAVTHDLAKEGYYAKQVSKRKDANKKAYR